MKIIKYIFIGILGLIALLLIIALFIPQKYQVERTITINQPDSIVFHYIKFLKNQDNFSVWSKMDPNMKQTFKGTDGTVGFVSAWESKNKNVGKGSQEIASIQEGKRIDFNLHFIEPQESNDKAYFITDGVSDSATRIVWGIKGKIPYPMNLMYITLNMDKMVGPDLMKGLENLKAILEKK